MGRQVTIAATFATSGVHMPSCVPPAARAQAWQSFRVPPPQAVAQQTPSTQKPLSHSALDAQASAFSFINRFNPYAYADPGTPTVVPSGPGIPKEVGAPTMSPSAASPTA
jgi:hypothetical protein